MKKTFSLVFTGISGSGKTALANLVAERLKLLGVPVTVIDGDVLREDLGNLFGYTREERMKQNRVVRTLVKYLNGAGTNVIVTLVAPYNEMRQEMRNVIGDAYIEVYTKCSVDACAARDVKGYYKKQKNGMMNNLNGADDLYEVPQTSEIIVDTERDSKELCAAQIIDYLRENGFVTYKYITNNNLKLENRQNYMYSEYGGRDFLAAYHCTRKNYIDKYDFDVSSINMLQNDIPKDNITANELNSLVQKFTVGEWDNTDRERLDYYIKAFEVRKRLYTEYEAGKVRPTEVAEYDKIVSYELLAMCVAHAYRYTQNLKYLNTLLKLNDILLSIAEGDAEYNGQVEKEKLSWLLSQELIFVKQNGYVYNM